MQLHEYQAKEILKENNVPVPEGKIATTSKASEEIAVSYTHLTLPTLYSV